MQVRAKHFFVGYGPGRTLDHEAQPWYVTLDELGVLERDAAVFPGRGVAIVHDA